MATAAGLHRATAAGRRFFCYQSQNLSGPESWLKSVREAMSGSGYSRRPSHRSAALRVMRRTFSSFGGYWPPGYGSESPIYNPWDQRIIGPSPGSPTLVRAPVWQISFTNPIDCNNEDWMLMDEFCYTCPMWRLINSNLLSQDENIYLLHEAWRRFIRVLGIIGSYNNSHRITTYPSFFKNNIKVSRRFLEPALIDPVGVHFDDPVLKATLHRQQANALAFTFHGLGSLILDIAKEYWPEIVTPLDVDILLDLMGRGVISEQAEMLIVNNPCLLPYSGRVQFTHYAHYLFSTDFALHPDDHDVYRARHDVLTALAEIGRDWQLPSVIYDPVISKLGFYSLRDVVDLQHGKLPLGLTKIGEIMLSAQLVPLLNLYKYFPVHVDAFKANTR